MMEELIARLEKADAGSRSLDWDIHLRDGPDGVGAYGDHPAYTTSLDAALTLVPSDVDYVHILVNRPGAFMVYTAPTESTNTGKAAVGRLVTSDPHDSHTISAATPALALCIAALKARQAAMVPERT